MVEEIKTEELTEREALIKLCKEREHYVTDEWTIRSILEKEILTKQVFDPCAGSGIMADIAKQSGYTVVTNDVEDWGYDLTYKNDFLSFDGKPFASGDFTVLMNPPFKFAEKFVLKALELGARKIVCFQRLSWYEGSYDSGKKRGKFWEQHRPARIYICGDRATCWRYDLEKNRNQETGIITDENGKELAESSTAHAWFVWERGHVPAGVASQIFRKRV